MTNVTTKDQDALSDMDFDAVCDVRVCYVDETGDNRYRACEAPAAWVGSLPCCGKRIIICDEHQKNCSIPYFCPVCAKHSRDLTDWRKL